MMGVVFQVTRQAAGADRKKEYDAAEKLYVQNIEKKYPPGERADALEGWIGDLKGKFPQPPKYIQYRLEWYQKKLEALEKQEKNEFAAHEKIPEIDTEMLQVVPERTDAGKKGRETSSLKTAKVDDVELRFRGEEAEGKVVKMGFRKVNNGRFEFFVEFSGSYEDFGNNREKFAALITDYIRTENGVENLIGMLKEGILGLYSSFGVKTEFELSGEILETLKERAATVKFECKNLSPGIAGLSNGVDVALKFLQGNGYIIVGGIAGAVAGAAILGGPAAILGITIGALLGWMTGAIFGSKVRNLEIASFDAMPHEMFHALSDNYRVRNGITRDYDEYLEEGLTSEMSKDWAYMNYRNPIRDYVQTLEPAERKETLDLLMRNWLNLKLSGEDEDKAERIIMDIFKGM